MYFKHLTTRDGLAVIEIHALAEDGLTYWTEPNVQTILVEPSLVPKFQKMNSPRWAPFQCQYQTAAQILVLQLVDIIGCTYEMFMRVGSTGYVDLISPSGDLRNYTALINILWEDLIASPEFFLLRQNLLSIDDEGLGFVDLQSFL